MPDDLTPAPAGAEGMRSALLAEAGSALTRLAPALPPAAGDLLRGLGAALPLEELAGMAPEGLASWAASLFGVAAARRPGEVALRLTPPAGGPGGGSGAGAVAEIATEDMPFLVDSVLAAISLSGRSVRRLLHPILAVRRAPDGGVVSIGPAVPGGPNESVMRIEIAPHGSGRGAPADWPAVEAALRQALAEVRQAVGDFGPMLERLRAAETEVAGAPEGAEAAAFLRWLAEDNFVLLGHRLLRIPADGGGISAEEGLGLLRDPAVVPFDALRNLSAVPAAVRHSLTETAALTVAKGNLRMRVHRPSHADVVATRILAPDGSVAGIRLFMGLFAATAYNRNPRGIPWLKSKVARILAASGAAPESHDARAFQSILDTWPRDELFQATEAEILARARRALDLTIRPRPALVVRRDSFGRYVSAIAWFPREVFDTRLRERVARLLAAAFGGRLSAFYIAISDTPLARVHYVIGTDPGAPVEVDVAALEAAVVQAARGFPEALAGALAEASGEAEGARLAARWAEAFPAAYAEAMTPAQAVADLRLAEAALTAGRPVADVSHIPGEGPRRLMLRLANPGGPLPLADALPLFESLDLRAIEEQPWRLAPAGGAPVVLHLFALEAGMEAPGVVIEDRFDELLGALSALLEGRAEADGFNRLVLRAGLEWREAWLIRALFRWCKQVGFAFPQPAVEAALAANPEAARLLVALFRARLDPEAASQEAESQAKAAWTVLMEGVADPDADRILSRLRTALDAVVRTNYFQGKDYLCIKIESARAGEMPDPRPWREIFVSAMHMEGCHLRAGPVARGGIRWSDRREDFRTEILGLMKAQRLKNVIIVPTGAKGGFILKGTVPPPSEREAFMAAGVAAYKTLIRAMLDVTDNLGADGGIIPPDRVVRLDGDDPYIVAAADKGTATFSDIANALSIEYGFWLGDAYASGGSAGYDHKEMGITARGAWVMVARHFAEMGRDIQAEPFTCVGVGDMSGDVFGNGLLISRKTRLLAAFDHRHIFIDPDPDMEASFNERERLFRLPRSSWDDYDKGLISAGGGVFPRNARTIPLSPEAQALLGIEAERAEPAAVMRAILKADVDLLYFGGIGTYVKAATESQAEAGDRANDALRVDGREIRAKVIGEGANLAVTQAGRIEAARLGNSGHGVAIDTDALDNSAGVSTSDHEVNIKILLAAAERNGALTRPQRDALLESMTDEVAALVLADNAAQFAALSLEGAAGTEALPAQAALMTRLEAEGLLDRAVLGLPSAAQMAERIGSGDALTRPEIAALLPVAKLWLTDAIEDGTLADDPAFLPLLRAYFPHALQERFPDLIEGHRLRRNLVATMLANAAANRLGPAGLSRLAEGDPAAVARAAWLADRLLGIGAAADALDAAAPEARRTALPVLRRLHEDAARALLDDTAPLAEAEARLRPGIMALIEAVPVPEGTGLPEAAARLVAGAGSLSAAIGIVRLAEAAGVAPSDAAGAWDAAGRDFGLEALRAAARAAPAPGAFGPRARAALLEDLGALQMRLARTTLSGAAPKPPEAVLRMVREAAGSGELAAVSVALRTLSMATHSGAPQPGLTEAA
ncbi:NAD-glutamate dehydrogenase [Pararoseomonas indoligenes]|uniref:NAD-glutamate dehydrogenase n=1 Tax=Roseomonas indoligenes TaxID=2820811 RepID=A0A940N787_9PROT|nr:NAD-glutamate dehydrogenase domain-containing protein [Pararoseomonas indoligenes]MBP0495382.1 NAD-glutamate dehydrogenase [Pararoseomonas indoligenes]